MDKLKLIKSVVVILTFLLVFGSMIMLGSIFRHSRSNFENIPAQINLKEPAGTTIDSMLENKGTLYLLLKNGGLPDRVVIIDPSTAQRRTTLNLN